MFLTYAASGEVPFGASLDEIDEIEQAIGDLDQGAAMGDNSPYWAKIRDRILESSSTKDVKQAVKEWVQDGKPWANRGVCELCDHAPIVFHFPIRNKVTGKTFIVGSECVYNYLDILGSKDREALRKRLITQINLLKKKQKGQASEADLDSTQESFQLESEVLGRISSQLGTDFDLLEYKEELDKANRIGSILRVKSVGFSAGTSAYTASSELVKTLDDLRKKVKSYQGYGLVEAVQAAMKSRDGETKVMWLSRLKKGISDLFSQGKPDEVIGRMWDAIRQKRDSLVDDLGKTCNEAKAKMMDEYSDELLVVKPYGHLSFTLSTGLEAHRLELDVQVEEASLALHQETFFDLLLTNDAQATKVLNMPFKHQLGYSDKRMALAAWQLTTFLGLLRSTAISMVVKAIEKAYGLPEVKDIAGVRVAVLKAADDGVIDADTNSLHTLGEFVKQLLAGDTRIGDFVQSEVDEVKALAKRTGHQKVHEKMSEDLDLDMEKVFKAYTSDRDFERSFCSSILKYVWPKGSKLSPAQVANIKQQLATKSKVKEVPHSMWAFFKTELTSPAKKS